VNISNFVNRGASDIDHGILHRGCYRFRKPGFSQPKLRFHRNALTHFVFLWMKSKRMYMDERYTERCCLHHILSEIFPLNTSDDANDACEYIEVLRRSHHAPSKGKPPGLWEKSRWGWWTWSKPQFSPVINTAVVRPLMHHVKTAKYRGFSPVFKKRINGLTSAIKKNRSKPCFFQKCFPWVKGRRSAHTSNCKRNMQKHKVQTKVKITFQRRDLFEKLMLEIQ
jgi:hypothetical protein